MSLTADDLSNAFTKFLYQGSVFDVQRAVDAGSLHNGDVLIQNQVPSSKIIVLAIDMQFASAVNFQLVGSDKDTDADDTIISRLYVLTAASITANSGELKRGLDKAGFGTGIGETSVDEDVLVNIGDGNTVSAYWDIYYVNVPVK